MTVTVTEAEMLRLVGDTDENRQLLADYGMLPMTGGVEVCDCPCHKTIEQGGGAFAEFDCIHCRIIGG